MSIIESVNDVDNTFLSRREITCNFVGLGGRLKKLEAVEMVSKKFKLDGKFVIPIRLSNHMGKPLVTGTFYVYEDEELAKKHVNPVIFKRLEKAKSGPKKKEKVEKPADEEATKAKDGDGSKKEKPTPAAENNKKESEEKAK